MQVPEVQFLNGGGRSFSDPLHSETTITGENHVFKKSPEIVLMANEETLTTYLRKSNKSQ